VTPTASVLPSLVVDASGLIALARLDLLDAAAVAFGPLRAADAAVKEASAEARAGSESITKAIERGVIVLIAADVLRVPDPENTVGLALGRGERATIEAATALGAIAVIDDRDARRVAVRRGCKVTGTLAILVRLRQRGAILSLRERLDELDRIGFRTSAELRAWALRQAKEDEA
jgi:predicted nucleic acid-binding protein